MILLIVLAFVQLVAIVVHGYILRQYKKYCGHCSWWSDFGAFTFLLCTFVPVVGIISCIVGPIDYIRNIVEVLKGEEK